MSKIYIVAMNYAAAHNYALENKLKSSEWSHIDDPDQLRGLTNPTVVQLSGWSRGKSEEWIERFVTILPTRMGR